MKIKLKYQTFSTIEMETIFLLVIGLTMPVFCGTIKVNGWV